MGMDNRLHKKIYDEYLEPILSKVYGPYDGIKYRLHSSHHGTVHIYSDNDFLLLAIDEIDLTDEEATYSYFVAKLDELDW